MSPRARILFHLASHSCCGPNCQAAAALAPETAVAAHQGSTPSRLAPSLSSPLDDPHGPATAYLEIHASTKAEVERCAEAVVAQVHDQGIVAAGPLTILSVGTHS